MRSVLIIGERVPPVNVAAMCAPLSSALSTLAIIS